MVDVAGQDSTEAFEDVGHSDEAREILEGLYIGDLKRLVSFFFPLSHLSSLAKISSIMNLTNNDALKQPGDPKPKTAPPPVAGASSTENAVGFGIGLYAVILVGGAAAYFAYQYVQVNGMPGQKA
jgi:hypothetical protein